MRTHALVISALLAISLPAQALDLKSVIKDAAQKSGVDTSVISPDKATETAAPESTAQTTETRPAFNWKNPSKEEEVQLGREITGNLLGAAPLVKDDALQKYVNQVGRWVASQSERADLPWRFGVIESEAINAFAAPGGYIVVTKGLYRKLENEAQLAGILAHEIGHVVRKHHLKVIQKQQLLNIGAGLLGDKVGKGNQAIEKVIGNGAEIMARGLDKNAEYEADRDGVTLATRAGYDPYGLPEVLQAISATSKDEGSLTLLYKTHPHPDERLAKLGDSIGNRLDNVAAGKTLPNRLYKLKN
ncbi:Beta-barrel assembly-enhancing protease [Methylophilaceae bacterium]|nr:Beta-barrel assembly-enhancing protease [Methylophilaceae bacterium]